MIKSISVLVFIVAARFYGLFVVLPILSVYAKDFSGANALIIGLIVGAYAMSQIIFQLPFGRLSDKIGRKKALALGFVVFLAGSLICAISSDVYTMILGRFIQGAGAVGAVASAFIADLSAAHQRGRAAGDGHRESAVRGGVCARAAGQRGEGAALCASSRGDGYL